MPAVIPVVAAVAGGLIASNGAKSAANTQAGASRDAAALQDAQYQQTRLDQKEMYNTNRTDQLAQIAQTRADQAPYRAAGTDALSRLQAGTNNVGGEFNTKFRAAAPFRRQAFSADPGYQFRLEQGEQGINRAAASRGGAYSGATLKALSRFNSGLASQEYANYDARQVTAQNLYNADRDFAANQFASNRDFRRNDLASLAGIGQTANSAVANSGQVATNAIGQAGQNSANTIAQAGMNNANQQGQALQNAGEARASGYVGTANAIGSGIKQLYNGYQQQQALNSGGWGSFGSNNAGVMQSTGLSAQELANSF